MQSLLVVDPLEKVRNSLFHILDGLVMPEVNLLVLQRLDETLSGSILVGISLTRHADLKAGLSQLLHKAMAGILHPPVRMMNTILHRLSLLHGYSESFEGKLRIGRTDPE